MIKVKTNDDFMFMMNYVNTFFSEKSVINSDEIAKSFSDYLKTLTDEIFIKKLIFTGYIPDIYASDSSEETLFTKLVEVMTSEWACRMGFKSEYVKQKASYQDVNIVIDGKIIVCDSKSFRLGRSQAAPNVKDFLKLADITKWLDRYPSNERLGGLVVYPCRHEWTKGSDAYQYCSTKSVPTLMLPYKYLAFLLSKKDNYDTKRLAELWNFNKLFPDALKNKSNNRTLYWNVVNKEISIITNSSLVELNDYMNKANEIIKLYINVNISYLKSYVNSIKDEKKKQLDAMDKELLEQMLLNLMIKEETAAIDQAIINIEKFRIDKKQDT